MIGIINHISQIINIVSHLPESNQRPTDYKSVALPAELKWLTYIYQKLILVNNIFKEKITDFFGIAKVKENFV